MFSSPSSELLNNENRLKYLGVQTRIFSYQSNVEIIAPPPPQLWYHDGGGVKSTKRGGGGCSNGKGLLDFLERGGGVGVWEGTIMSTMSNERPEKDQREEVRESV